MRHAGVVEMLRRMVWLGGFAGVVALAACERPASRPRAVAGCPFTAADTTALAVSARDTIGRLKAHPQRITQLMPVAGGVAFRTEDVDSAALHNGGTVSFDCSKRVTMVWLDGG